MYLCYFILDFLLSHFWGLFVFFCRAFVCLCFFIMLITINLHII